MVSWEFSWQHDWYFCWGPRLSKEQENGSGNRHNHCQTDGGWRDLWFTEDLQVRRHEGQQLPQCWKKTHEVFDQTQARSHFRVYAMPGNSQIIILFHHRCISKVMLKRTLWVVVVVVVLYLTPKLKQLWKLLCWQNCLDSLHLQTQFLDRPIWAPIMWIFWGKKPEFENFLMPWTERDLV